MKDIELKPSMDEAMDKEQLEYVLREVQKQGFTAAFSPDPIAWRANNRLHFDVTNEGRYIWINSKGKLVIVFLLVGFACKGYRVCELDADLDLSP